jgi:hypothetical protein
MATLGAEIVFIAPGEVHVAFPFAAQCCQQNGFMHAGAIASVADSANGYAAYPRYPIRMCWRWSSRSTCWHRHALQGFWPAAACYARDGP